MDNDIRKTRKLILLMKEAQAAIGLVALIIGSFIGSYQYIESHFATRKYVDEIHVNSAIMLGEINKNVINNKEHIEALTSTTHDNNDMLNDALSDIKRNELDIIKLRLSLYSQKEFLSIEEKAEKEILLRRYEKLMQR